MMEYRFQDFYIPERMLSSLERYRDQHIPVGSFLQAVLTNDFQGACGKADDENMHNLPAYAAWVHNELPYNAHGSPSAYRSWVERMEVAE